jgi:hypothetical protein
MEEKEQNNQITSLVSMAKSKIPNSNILSIKLTLQNSKRVLRGEDDEKQTFYQNNYILTAQNTLQQIKRFGRVCFIDKETIKIDTVTFDKSDPNNLKLSIHYTVDVDAPIQKTSTADFNGTFVEKLNDDISVEITTCLEDQ